MCWVVGFFFFLGAVFCFAISVCVVKAMLCSLTPPVWSGFAPLTR